QTVCRKLQDVHRCRVIEHIEETFDFHRRLGETASKWLVRITHLSPHLSHSLRGAKNGALRMSVALEMVPTIAWKRAAFFLKMWEVLKLLERQNRSDRPRIRQSERFLKYAIFRLEKHHPADKWLAQATEEFAWCFVSTDNKDALNRIDALKFAETAVRFN